MKPRKIVTTKDCNRSRRVAKRRDFREEARLDELAAGETVGGTLSVQQEMNWLEPGRERRLDEIFALTTE